MIRPAPNLYQIAWVVADIDAAMNQWVNTHGIGPFFVARETTLEMRHKGGSMTVVYSMAVAQTAGVQIEFIQVHGEGPPIHVVQAEVEAKALNHICIMVENIDETILHYEALGCELCIRGEIGNIRWAYMDTKAQTGFITEICEDEPSFRKIRKMVADASENWDGENPIRPLFDDALLAELNLN